MKDLKSYIDILFRDYASLSEESKTALVRMRCLMDIEDNRIKDFITLEKVFADIDISNNYDNTVLGQKMKGAIKYLIEETTTKFINDWTISQILRIPNVGRKTVHNLQLFLKSNYGIVLNNS